MSFFWKFSTKFDLGFFELTKCNFRRHFGEKTWNFMCLECFLTALPQQRHLNKWNPGFFTRRLVKTEFHERVFWRGRSTSKILEGNEVFHVRRGKEHRFYC